MTAVSVMNVMGVEVAPETQPSEQDGCRHTISLAVALDVDSKQFDLWFDYAVIW